MSEKLLTLIAMLVSRKDAVGVTGLSLRSIDYLISNGELEVKKVGRRTMILRASLEKFCKSDRSVPITERPAERQ